MTDRSKSVVLLIDWDNLQICHNRDAPGTDLDLQALIALAQSYGTLVSARAYAEWNLPIERMAVYKAGIEPVFAPVMRPEGGSREGKSLADTVMVADGVDLLWTVAPDVFVLVTSDKDMIPLARIAKQRGAAVVILGSDLTAIPLVELSNVFITYRQLVRELDRTTELEAPAGRAPARERRFLREARPVRPEPLESRLAAESLEGGAVSRRGAARPAVEALRSPPPPRSVVPSIPVAPSAATVLGNSSSVVPADNDPEEGATVTVEGLGRRRRRRGRRRGGSGLADEQQQPNGLEGLANAMDDALAEPPVTIADARGAEAAGPESVGDREPSDVIDTPPTRARTSARPSRTRRSSPLAAPTTSFSEFGPTPSPVAETPPNASSSEAGGLLGSGGGIPPAGEEPATSAESTGATERLGAVAEGLPLGTIETGAAVLSDASTETPGAVSSGQPPALEAEAASDAVEEKPKAVRRRRTRTPG